MKPDDLESRMREREYFHRLRLPPGSFAVVRVDGRGFSRLTKTRFEKPMDARFHELMVTTAASLLTGLQALYAYTESDEISVLLPRDWALFDRELEKLVSLSAANASSTFTATSGIRAEFDSRVWIGATEQDVVDYFRWRQADATRCGLNGWCYWTLRKAGKSVAEATKALEGRDVAWKNELLFQNGVNFNDTPLWQRRGTGLYVETYEKAGRDPRTGEDRAATRRRVRVDAELPMGDGYAEFLRRLFGGTG